MKIRSLFHPAVDGAALRARLGLTNRFVVGLAGKAMPWHDLHTLVEAMAYLRADANTLRPYHLLLVGRIPRVVRRALAQRGLADATTIVGKVPHDQMPEYIAAMDVAVSPHPAQEGRCFSQGKLLECLACGVATVAADVAPVANVVAHGVTAVLYPPGDANALADRIAVLAAHRGSRARLGWRGASHVLRHHARQRSARQPLQWSAPVPSSTQGAPQMEVELPILDDTLRTCLYRATRADLAGPLLAGYLPRAGGLAYDRVTHLEVLKYKPNRRCVVAYDLGPSAGGSFSNVGQRLVGKVFRDDRGAQHKALHQTLWADGFGEPAADGITVAQPLAYIPEMRMFVQERAPGRTLDGSLDAPDFGDRVRRCAVAIAKLHDCRIRPPAHYSLLDHLASLEVRAAEMATWRPDRAEAIGRQFARLRAWAATLPPADMAPAHRDFYYSQVLFGGARVTLIDLDLFALADPAIDVASFVAHLRLLAMQRLPDPCALDAAAAAFVDEYARQAAPSAGFLSRLAFYEAATYFRLMYVTLQRPRPGRCFDPLFEICETGRILSGIYQS